MGRSDLGRMKEERKVSEPLGRRWCIHKHGGWFSLNVQSSVTAVMSPWSLPTVPCLFSHGQEGLLPWASSGDSHPHAARNLWGPEDAAWKPLSLRPPYGSLRSQSSLFKWPPSPLPGSLQAHPWIYAPGDTPGFRCAHSQVQGCP